MNVVAVGLLGYLLLCMDRAVSAGLAINVLGMHAQPSFLLPFVMLIAMSVPQATALWTALVFGLLSDLTLGGPPVIGPYALGFMLAAYFTVTTRRVMLSRNPFALVVLSVVGQALCIIVVVGLTAVRRWFVASGSVTSASELFWNGLGGAFYTGLSAFVLGFVFRRLAPILGLSDASTRRSGRYP